MVVRDDAGPAAGVLQTRRPPFVLNERLDQVIGLPPGIQVGDEIDGRLFDGESVAAVREEDRHTAHARDLAVSIDDAHARRSMQRYAGLELEARFASVDVKGPTERDMVLIGSLKEVLRRGVCGSLRIPRGFLAQFEDLALQLLDVALPFSGPLKEHIGRALRALGITLHPHDIGDRPLELLDHALDPSLGLFRHRGQLPDVCCAAVSASGLEAGPRARDASEESAHRANTEPTLRTCAHRGDDHRRGRDDSPGKQVRTLFDGARGPIALGVGGFAHGALVRPSGRTLGAQRNHVHPNIPWMNLAAGRAGAITPLGDRSCGRPPLIGV